MSIPLNTIYSYFETGDFPTEEQFQASWSSFWHKDESIPTNKIAGLETQLQNKADKNIFETHISNPDSHANYLAKKDASNLDNVNVQAWKSTLGVGELPENIATIDDANNTGNVYTKNQSDSRYMFLDDFVNDDEKILAEKIEALGLTTLIESVETTISEFANHSNSYEFEDNDFIAIPDVNGNYSLFMFKGGVKTDKKNYLPTGISNVTMGMVEGLQAALNGKVDKPLSDGSFFTKMVSGVTTWQTINPTATYLTLWNGSNFAASPIFTDGAKLGVGTTSPTEMFHLNNGRIRSKGVVLDENTETLINQITCFNRKLLFTDSTGTRKTVLTVEDLPSEFMVIPSKLTEAQKTTWKTEMNGGFTTATMSVGSILPAVTPFQDTPTWVTLRGANLNFNPANFSISIIDNAGVVLATISNSQVNLISGTELSFYYNFYSLGVGNYKFRLNNGIAIYDTGFTLNITDNIVQIPIGKTTWGEKYYNDYDSSNQTADGGTINFKVDPAQKPLADESSIVYKVKAIDNLVFTNTDNFYIEMNISYLDITSKAPSGVSVIISNSPDLNLSDDSLAVIKLRGYGGGTGAIDLLGVLVSDYYNGANLNIRIIKQGSQLSIAFKTINPNMVSREGLSMTSIINTTDLYLGFAFGNKQIASAASTVNIVTAYKF